MQVPRLSYLIIDLMISYSLLFLEGPILLSHISAFLDSIQTPRGSAAKLAPGGGLALTFKPSPLKHGTSLCPSISLRPC
jgi:hypothetical protein